MIGAKSLQQSLIETIRASLALNNELCSVTIVVSECKNIFMYTQVWKKYLPIIRILMKKASDKSQTLDMNRIDFERAGSGRKAGYKFHIKINNGRVTNVISGSALALDLAEVLLQDEAAKKIISKNDYDLSFNPRFQLIIEQTSQPSNEEPDTNSS
jgi:hypothetical protein